MTHNVILILDGPNMNLVGVREPEIYGTRSMGDYVSELRSRMPDIDIIYRQSNHEGVMLDILQEYGFGKADGIVLNAAAYTHTSIALRDCVKAIKCPVIEVHISDIRSREPFRQHSYLTDVCAATISGKGLQGYALAVEQLKKTKTTI